MDRYNKINRDAVVAYETKKNYVIHKEINSNIGLYICAHVTCFLIINIRGVMIMSIALQIIKKNPKCKHFSMVAVLFLNKSLIKWKEM